MSGFSGPPIGQYTEHVILAGASVTLGGSVTPQTILTIPNLPAGDWDLTLVLYYYITSGTPTISRAGASISILTNTFQTAAGQFFDNAFSAFTPPSTIVAQVANYRIQQAAAASIFGVAFATVSAPANFGVYGKMSARRFG